jgi:hypothetical protein
MSAFGEALMGDYKSASRPTRRPITIGRLMVWVLAVAAVLACLKGDLAIWLFAVLVLGVPFGAIVGTIVGIPWLAYMFSRSPESMRAPSALSRLIESLLAVALVGVMTVASAVIAWLGFTILDVAW